MGKMFVLVLELEIQMKNNETVDEANERLERMVFEGSKEIGIRIDKKVIESP